MRRQARSATALVMLVALAVTGTVGMSSSGLAAATAAETLGDSPPLDWAVRAGGTGSDYATDMALSTDGAATVTGGFSGSATFGMGTEALTLSSAGSTDAFLARYDADGSLRWAVREGGTDFDLGRGVAVDTVGGATVTGTFRGSVTFGTGVEEITLADDGSTDMFVARYDHDGTLDWAVPASNAESRGIASAPDGGTVVTGRYVGTATFGAGTDTVTLTEDGNGDVFVARYNPDGSLAWAVDAGGTGSDSGHGVAVAADGAVTVTGDFNQTATFGSGADATTLDSVPWPDAFVARYHPDGSLDWVVQAGGDGEAGGRGVAVGPDGAATVTGEFGRWAKKAVFSPGTGHTLYTGGYADAFVARYATDGSLDWVRRAGGSSHDSGNDVALGPDGSATVTGYFFGSATFEGGSEPLILTGAGGDDAFTARYGPDGSLEWAVRAGGIYRDGGAGVGVGADGAVTVAGTFRSVATFGSGADGVTLTAPGTSASNSDVFLARYRPAMLDATAPTVAITSPADASSHLLNSQLPAAYSCADEIGGSGIATCVGTVAVDEPVDTTTVGRRTFTVTASDVAGNTDTASTAYDVVYGFSGYGAPLREGENVVSAGRKLAFRFSVFDAEGDPVSTITNVKATSVRYACESGDQPETIEELVAGNPGLKNFGDGSYQFNFSTSRAWAGSCRTLGLDLGDGLPRAVDFRFR